MNRLKLLFLACRLCRFGYYGLPALKLTLAGCSAIKRDHYDVLFPKGLLFSRIGKFWKRFKLFAHKLCAPFCACLFFTLQRGTVYCAAQRGVQLAINRSWPACKAMTLPIHRRHGQA